MANYKVVVELTARVEYEVEMELDGNANYREAEDKAINMWRDKIPADFDVEKGYIERWDAEAEQTSWQCEECGKEIETRDEFEKYDELCEDCFTTADRSLSSIKAAQR